MKKILFAMDEIGISGIVSVANNLCACLLEQDDMEISVLCLSISDRTKIDMRIPVFDLDLNKYGKKQRYLKLIPSIKDFFSSHRFDTLVVCGMEFVPFYFIACKNIKGMKKIAWEHRNFNTYPKYRLEWFGRRIACKSFDHVVCLTKRDHGYYLDYLNDREKIRQIYNIMKIQKNSAEYDVESKTILSIGSLHPIKGFDMLLEIAEIVLKKHDDWIWEIYGAGAELENLQRMASEKKLTGKVLFKGFVSDVSQVYKKSSFFVLTSRAEGMPSVLIEAKRHYLPVVSFDIDCGPSDVIEDGINGFLIKPYDVCKMAERISALIEDSNLRLQMSKNSENDLSDFETESIVNSWKEIL